MGRLGSTAVRHIERAVFRNATIILLSATGRSKKSIANDLECSIGTEDMACQRYRHP
jgi:hypothetical protein